MTLQLDNIYGMLLIFVRTGALFIAVPVFGGAEIPAYVSIGLGLAESAMLLPLCPAVPMAGAHATTLLIAMGCEFFLGLMMGMALMAVFSGIEFAAETITNEIGLLRAQAFNPSSEDGGQGGGVSSLLYYFSLMIFLAVGAHRMAILALARSFDALPAGCMSTGNITISTLTYFTTQIFVLGLLMSAPFIAVNFLINATFSLLGKVAPKMNVFVVSFSVRILAGLAVLATTAMLLAHYVSEQFTQAPDRMLEIIVGR